MEESNRVVNIARGDVVSRQPSFACFFLLELKSTVFCARDDAKIINEFYNWVDFRWDFLTKEVF